MNKLAVMKKRVLVLSPHADDMEIGCGGYVSKVIEDGGEVFVALATIGSIQFLHRQAEVTAEVRRVEFDASLKVLGVQHHCVIAPGFDSRLNMFPMGEMVAALDRIQDEFKPDEVLIPTPSSHQDHKYCWEVGIATTRPSIAKHQPSVVAAYEYPQSFWGTEAQSHGGVYVDVTPYWAKKVEALSKYASQMREGISLIGINGVEALARLRGVECGVEKAELFHALRIVVK